MVRLLSERFPLSRPKHLLRRATKLAGLAARHITEGASYRRARKQQSQRKDRDLQHDGVLLSRVKNSLAFTHASVSTEESWFRRPQLCVMNPTRRTPESSPRGTREKTGPRLSPG